jgi:hypothetical protein
MEGLEVNLIFGEFDESQKTLVNGVIIGVGSLPF